MEQLFFDSWSSIFRTVVITILAYVALIIMLRTFGKRSLSKMNAFDFIITVALGSTLATVSLTKNVALADGVLSFLLLLLLQYSITFLSVRYKAVKNLVTSQPAMLYYHGQVLQQAMKKERITIDELHAKARESGYSSLTDVAVIVLETTGDITVLGHHKADNNSTLQNVKRYDKQTQ